MIIWYYLQPKAGTFLVRLFQQPLPERNEADGSAVPFFVTVRVIRYDRQISAAQLVGCLNEGAEFSISNSLICEAITHLDQFLYPAVRMHDKIHFVLLVVLPAENILCLVGAASLKFDGNDIFVLPSPQKIWRPELLEAMSVGNAVVVANGLENDLVVDGKTALAVPVHDELALSKAMEKLIMDRQFAKTLAKQSQDYLRKHFLVSRMISRLAKAYRQALKIKTLI